MAFAALARALAVATTAVTFVHASTHSHNPSVSGGHEHHAAELGRAAYLNRAASDVVDVKRQAAELPEGWTVEGCWVDNNGGRTLQQANLVSQDMTQELCANFCNDGGWAYAGVEYSVECYCDDYIRAGGAEATDPTTCGMTCGGNPNQLCGGPGRLTLMYSNVPPPPPPPPPTVVAEYGLWESIGCYTEGQGGRTLPFGVNSAPFGGADNMTVENCLDACLANGYPNAGIEYAVECYCGTSFLLGGAPATDAACNAMTCKGNSSQICGGPDRLQAYHYTGEITIDPTPPGGGGGGPAVPDGPPPPPQTEDLPGSWHYIACYADGAAGRALLAQKDDDQTLTPTTCINYCASKNYTIAGMEFSFQCFCDNKLRQGVAPVVEAQCNMGCAGDASFACGAGSRLSVYASTPTVEVLPVPTAKTTGLVAGWEFQSCMIEPDQPAPRMLPHRRVDEANMDVNNCIERCHKFGYPAAGLEYGNECYCGDIEDMEASPGPAPITECGFSCPGTPTELCGAGNRLLYYQYKGTKPLYDWHRPNVTGRYEFLVGGPIVPLSTALGLNNKVTFLEKLGSGPQNSTHAYELDYTLAHDITKAWRDMHVKTDIFCAAGVILPDKAGRQINVGGWSLESTFGVRLYTPDGHLGTNSTNDWEEDYDQLALQIGRWYPSSMMLANGSILVMGGQRGANDIPVPSVEILPRIPGGSTLLELKFLRDLDPLNLYPHLWVTPVTGSIFVLSHNDARLLDPATFADRVILDNVPGSVTEVAGRTYPNSAGAVMLPMHAPFTEPFQVLTCGGSPGGGGTALDNCAVISPEAADAHWEIERMPFRRVLACFTSLPDGTFLITNGAQEGTGGFGLASNPTLTALLYDPYQPLGSRISILNTTIVARMYHSEAILLHDGRVLISGSDPLTTVYNDDGSINEELSYPEEYRVEVYIPPYLATGRTQPTFNITNTDWEYNKQYNFTVNLAHGTTSTMRVSLLGAVISTHGNNFGQRTLFLEFSCTGNVCTTRAPPHANLWPPGWGQLFVLDGPTPSFSTWVRVGGDPAGLGNWPNLPGFTVPGV